MGNEWVSSSRSPRLVASPPTTQTTVQRSLSFAQDVSRPGDAGNRGGSADQAVLRWRSPEVARAADQPAAPAMTAALTTITPIRERGARAQVASADLTSIPYAEPDSSVVSSEPSRTAVSRATVPAREVPPRELPPLPLDAQPARQPTERPAAPVQPTSALWQDDPPPGPETLPPPTGGSLLGNRRSTQTASCERVYNERDCCAEEQRCATAQEFVQRDALARIYMDITPRLRPTTSDPYQEEALRNRDLAEAPSRTWRDRQGNVLAKGRMTNIMRGRLLILDDNNNVVKLAFHELSDDDLCFTTAWWKVPTECTLGEEHFDGRHWQPLTMTWKATGSCHKPLYFEDVQLERYGHSAGPIRQPVLSGAHFFASLVTLPYQAGINPPWECQYALGYYRPGSCAPWMIPPVPLSVRGALWQAGAVVGGVFVIP